MSFVGSVEIERDRGRSQLGVQDKEVRRSLLGRFSPSPREAGQDVLCDPRLRSHGVLRCFKRGRIAGVGRRPIEGGIHPPRKGQRSITEVSFARLANDRRKSSTRHREVIELLEIGAIGQVRSGLRKHRSG